MSFAVGSLVQARGREWVVLPDSTDELLLLRPLGGADVEIAGVLPAIEEVRSAAFAPPDAGDIGDFASARLLHEALRLSVRSSAGPFRSFGRIAVEPRPYQLVPLLMALRLDPIRLLIADDVGIGKTVEAALIARELIDRGEIRRMSVLCPPHLAEQWQDELREKFHLEAELVLASTSSRLERGLPQGMSLFERYDVTIVSTDFIKSDRRRDEFLRAAPEFVIVDEAHTCADASAGRGGRHQRFQLVSGLAAKPDRHLVLVTATPHSGSAGAFRELTGFLDRSFRTLPEDPTRAEQAEARKRLAAHLVQRRRSDIRAYLEAETPFPDRLTQEQTYKLTPEYRAFFREVLAYARQTVRDPADGNRQRQRVRWWSAIALLQAIGSSPMAAEATLKSRSETAGAMGAREADEIGERLIFDAEDEASDGIDVVSGSDIGDGPEGTALAATRRLRELAAKATGLTGKLDAKVAKAVTIVQGLLKEDRTPIVFCRFIATAEYVQDELQRALGAKVVVASVTGRLPGEEREARVQELAQKRQAGERVVMVATDCLSEGVNLQETFDAVVHYDLSWNPTRHEQREGRVDRFLQPKPTVKIVTLYGEDNPIDGHVLKVLIRRHAAIVKELGISVPVPGDRNKILSAILENLLLTERADDLTIEQLTMFEELTAPVQKSLDAEWTNVSEREKRSRTVFAQMAIDPKEVAAELEAARAAVGRGVDVRRFVEDVFRRANATVAPKGDGVTIELGDATQAFRDTVGVRDGKSFVARFDLPRRDRELVLTRTHPVVEGLAGWVSDTALDHASREQAPARRAGVSRTTGVQSVTTALLLRVRYDIEVAGPDPLLAEEVRIVAFRGDPSRPQWLDPEEAEALLALEPTGLVVHDQARRGITSVLDAADALHRDLAEQAVTWADELRGAHQRVRRSAQLKGRVTVGPHTPVDLVGIYQFLPHVQA